MSRRSERRHKLRKKHRRERRALNRQYAEYKQSSASDTVMRVLSNPGIDDYVTTATELEGIMRRHGASEADVDVVRERFFKAYPQLKALAQQLKGKK